MFLFISLVIVGINCEIVELIVVEVSGLDVDVVDYYIVYVVVIVFLV